MRQGTTGTSIGTYTNKEEEQKILSAYRISKNAQWQTSDWKKLLQQFTLKF